MFVYCSHSSQGPTRPPSSMKGLLCRHGRSLLSLGYVSFLDRLGPSISLYLIACVDYFTFSLSLQLTVLLWILLPVKRMDVLCCYFVAYTHLVYDTMLSLALLYGLATRFILLASTLGACWTCNLSMQRLGLWWRPRIGLILRAAALILTLATV